MYKTKLSCLIYASLYKIYKVYLTHTKLIYALLEKTCPPMCDKAHKITLFMLEYGDTVKLPKSTEL